MDLKIIAVVSLRAAAIVLGGQGNTQAAQNLEVLARAIEAGINVDAHMQVVADAMNAGKTTTWDDVQDRINADGDRLQELASSDAKPEPADHG
jgi:hypothetical protein